MSYTAIVVQQLKTALSLQDGQLGPINVPDDALFPYVSVIQLTGKDTESMDGDSGLVQAIMQVSCWNTDYQAAFDSRTVVKAEMRRLDAGVLSSSFIVQGANHIIDAELYDPIRKLFQLITRFKVFFEKV
jgi:hypothetical protein